ncbi:MAG: hypothetical protein PUB69_00380 [Desulfovibrionaceae bacterium]|nr:hypothetical protein [Desulfovibrionaceae bacterium]
MAYQKGFVYTLAELEDFYKGSHAGDVIELANQINDILDDVIWMESNQSDGHLTRIRTGLPTIHWRRIYQGVEPSKSVWTQVKEPCAMLEARMELDIKEVELYGDRGRLFRMSEGKAFLEAMREKVAATIFYGDHTECPDEFNGLAIRYSQLSGGTSSNVISAGGSNSGKLTSMYLIAWGADTVHGIYPKGSKGGIDMVDLGERTVLDSEKNPFEAVVDRFTWNCGLAVRDWRSVVRICNIDTAKLTVRKGASGYIDLQALAIRAANAMPPAMRQRAIWYASPAVLTALEMQSADSGNVQLHYGQYFDSENVPFVLGRPVRRCDALLSSEEAVA